MQLSERFQHKRFSSYKRYCRKCGKQFDTPMKMSKVCDKCKRITKLRIYGHD